MAAPRSFCFADKLPGVAPPPARRETVTGQDVAVGGAESSPASASATGSGSTDAQDADADLDGDSPEARAAAELSRAEAFFETVRPGATLVEWCPKPGLARHMGAVRCE